MVAPASEAVQIEVIISKRSIIARQLILPVRLRELDIGSQPAEPVQEVSQMLIRILGHCDRAGNVVIDLLCAIW